MISILKFLWKNRTLVLLAISIILFILYVNGCSKIKSIQNKNKQNISALNDSITTFKNKEGKLVHEKSLLIADKNELKDLNKELWEELEEEKKKKPKVIIKTEIEYRDTGSITNVISDLGNNNYSLNFEYLSNDSFLFVKGENNFSAKTFIINPDSNKVNLQIFPGTTKLDYKFNIPLTLGIKTEDGLDKIYIKTENEKFKVTKLDAVEVENYFKEKYNSTSKPKKFGFGFYVGYGLNLTPNTGVVKAQPSIGVGLQYNIIRF